MLRFQKLRSLCLFIVLLILMAIPVSAQDSVNGLTVDIDESGVSVYRINDDGSQTLIIFVPAITQAIVEAEASTAPASADVLTSGHLIVNTSALNVRSGAGVKYTVVATVAGGDRLNVVGQNDGRESWWYVELADGTRGWVNNIHTIIRGSLAAAPVIESVGIIVQPTLYIGYPGNLIFPTLPHDGNAVCSLPGRVEFPIIGRSQSTNWYQIVATCQDGTAVTGWVQGEIGAVRNPAGLVFPVTDNN